MSRRPNGRKRQRLPVAVVTGASVVLVLVVALARRVLLVLPKGRSSVLQHSELEAGRRSTAASTRKRSASRPILTAFLEPPDTLQSNLRPLPPRTTSASRLTKIEYPKASQCSNLMETWPIDDFPTQDAFLPWIHDVFPSGDHVKIVAQNRRRCHTGEGMENEMKHWEPQMALLQPVPVDMDESGNYRLSSVENATWKETRFLCRFHTAEKEYTTLSEFPFNYEYVTWRKGANSMYKTTGTDNQQFWLSQLLFSCPIPKELQPLISTGEHVENDQANVWLDLVPIRTPARVKPLLTQDHVGPDSLGLPMFNTTQEWGSQHVLPAISDSGRWANIPICRAPEPRRKRLVACTWTAASYTRRGDATTVGDTARRLREWILFHHLVGFEQVNVYDNTAAKDSPLREICNEFDFVQYHKWPASVWYDIVVVGIL